MTRSNRDDVRVSQSLGDAIQWARKRRRLTQPQMAKKIGVSLRTITTWEGGLIPPERIDEVETVLNVKFVRGTGGQWRAVLPDDIVDGAPELAGTEVEVADTPAGQVVLFLDPSRLAGLPVDVLEEARAAAQLEFLARIRTLMRDYPQTPPNRDASDSGV